MVMSTDIWRFLSTSQPLDIMPRFDIFIIENDFQLKSFLKKSLLGVDRRVHGLQVLFYFRSKNHYIKSY